MKSGKVRWIGWGLLAAGAVLLGLWGARVYRTARSLLGHVNEAQVLMAEGVSLDIDLERAERLVYGTRSDVVALRRDVGWAAKLGPAFRWVPKVGPTLADAAPLLDLADALTALGTLFWKDAALGLSLLDDGVAPGGVLLAVQPGMAAKVPEAQALVARASAAFAEVDVEALPWRMRQLALLEMALPLAEDGLAWLPFVSVLAGAESPRTYLLWVLNESELRPGGGFITGVGEVRVAGGRVTSMQFLDSYAVDDFAQPYPPAPAAFERFMNVDLMVFRDSNWSPDFPTTARLGAELYRPGHPVTVDGVFAVDQYAAEQLVDVIGPLSVPGEAKPLTGAMLMEYIYATWAPEDGQFDGAWWKGRKSIMGPLADAVLARIENGNVDWAGLAQTGLRLLEERHVQVYFANEDAEALLATRGWDGSLRLPASDYVTVVEANLGFNKASAKLLRDYTYAVDLTQSPPQATMTLVYTHTSQVEIACISEPRYDAEYTQMMDRCYWGYLQLYVPEEAQLVDASRHPIPASSVADGMPWDGHARSRVAAEGAYTVFEQALLLPPASQTTVRFSYTLPVHVVTASEEVEGGLLYRLLWQKQAGLQGVPARVILRLPRNVVLCAQHPQPTSDANGVLLYDVTLDVDQSFEVCYRLLEE